MKYSITIILLLVTNLNGAFYPDQAPMIEQVSKGEQAPPVEQIRLEWYEHETGGYGLWVINNTERLIGYWDGKFYYPLKDGKWLLPLGQAPIKPPVVKRVIRVLNSSEVRGQRQQPMRMLQQSMFQPQPRFQPMMQPMMQVQPRFNFSRSSSGCST